MVVVAPVSGIPRRFERSPPRDRYLPAGRDVQGLHARERERTGGPATVLLHVHGGGWAKGTRRFLQFNYRGGLPGAMLELNTVIVSVEYVRAQHTPHEITIASVAVTNANPTVNATTSHYKPLQQPPPPPGHSASPSTAGAASTCCTTC